MVKNVTDIAVGRDSLLEQHIVEIIESFCSKLSYRNPLHQAQSDTVVARHTSDQRRDTLFQYSRGRQNLRSGKYLEKAIGNNV